MNIIMVGATENDRPKFDLTYVDGWPREFPADLIAYKVGGVTLKALSPSAAADLRKNQTAYRGSRHIHPLHSLP